jgi:hypothetical protein
MDMLPARDGSDGSSTKRRQCRGKNYVQCVHALSLKSKRSECTAADGRRASIRQNGLNNLHAIAKLQACSGIPFRHSSTRNWRVRPAEWTNRDQGLMRQENLGIRTTWPPFRTRRAVSSFGNNRRKSSGFARWMERPQTINSEVIRNRDHRLL